MGYYGLPSKACSACRTRRVKCDLSHPSCGQCIRAHRICSGYRNRIDLLFHDQSEEVANKAQQHKPTSRRKGFRLAESKVSLSSPFIPLNSALSISKQSEGASIPSSLPISAESQAFCFFFSNYPCLPSRNFESVYKEIPAMYCLESADSPLLCIVTALGLAGLSHHTEKSGMNVAASIWYDKALHKINRILRDQQLVKEDQTLLVVLLLGLYETNTCTTPRSMRSWLKHINGATALLSLRGEEQLKREFGRTLFIQARTQITAGCYQTRSRIPKVVIKLSYKFDEASGCQLSDICNIIFQFCDIRSDRPFHPPPSQTESTTRATMAHYTAIARALADWHANLPPQFLATRKPRSSVDSDVLSGSHESYEDIWTAGLQNNYRANSILVHEALISQLLYLSSLRQDPELDTLLRRSRCETLSLVKTLCASVPSLLRSGFAAAGVGLLWPLYVAAQLSPRTVGLDETTRAWIIGRLGWIGSEMGVKQATMLAKLLRGRVEVTDLLLEVGEDE